MSPATMTGLLIGLAALIGGIATVLGWRSGSGTRMPIPSPAVATGHSSTAVRDAERVAVARDQQRSRAQELRNASTTVDLDERSDALARAGGRSPR